MGKNATQIWLVFYKFSSIYSSFLLLSSSASCNFNSITWPSSGRPAWLSFDRVHHTTMDHLSVDLSVCLYVRLCECCAKLLVVDDDDWWCEDGAAAIRFLFFYYLNVTFDDPSLPLSRWHGNAAVVVVVAPGLFADKVLDGQAVLGSPHKLGRLQHDASLLHAAAAVITEDPRWAVCGPWRAHGESFCWFDPGNFTYLSRAVRWGAVLALWSMTSKFSAMGFMLAPSK